MTMEEPINERNTKIGGTPFPPFSNAVTTKMFTHCKKCGTPNANGYQYCTACHKSHKKKTGKRGVRTVASAQSQHTTPAKPTVSNQPPARKPVDRDEVLKECRTEL
jgi:uncharacterized Zn finger protein (UPF0148 family)